MTCQKRTHTKQASLSNADWGQLRKQISSPMEVYFDHLCDLDSFIGGL